MEINLQNLLVLIKIYLILYCSILLTMIIWPGKIFINVFYIKANWKNGYWKGISYLNGIIIIENQRILRWDGGIK